jgi:hypothetical protein
MMLNAVSEMLAKMAQATLQAAKKAAEIAKKVAQAVVRGATKPKDALVQATKQTLRPGTSHRQQP